MTEVQFERLLLAAVLATMGCGRWGFDPIPLVAGEQEADAGIELLPAADDSGLVDILAPEVQWLLPDAVRVKWDRSGDAVAFAASRVLVVDLDAATIDADITAAIFDGASNPELAYWELPGTTDTDPVLATTIDGLNPDTTYAFQVQIQDTDGTWSRSEAVSFTTPKMLTNELVLFAEAAPAGFSLPDTLVYTNTGPHSGSQNLEYVFTCPNGDPGCFENLRRQGVGIDTSVIPEAAFDAAYIELYLSTGGSTPAWWTEVRLMLEGTGPRPLYSFKAFTVPDSGSAYVRVAVPLAAMGNASESLTHASLLAGIHEWGIGAKWMTNVPVRIDDVRIRY